jgi:hypothetical protein
MHDDLKKDDFQQPSQMSSSHDFGTRRLPLPSADRFSSLQFIEVSHVRAFHGIEVGIFLM